LIRSLYTARLIVTSAPARNAVTGSHVPLAVRQEHYLPEHSALA